jgi:alpha-beta hydrolase superfamily lysophospholipase
MDDFNRKFTFEKLKLKDDNEGEVFATLISAKANTPNRSSVLCIHGYVDYFFQLHMAERFNREGYDFFALDLRRHGRSLLPHQRPNFCTDLTEYFEEIDLAIEKISAENPDKIILLGHSTGGLISAMYMNTGKARNKIDALILNAPFLDFNQSPFLRPLSRIVAGIMSRVFPGTSIKKTIPPAYGQSLHKEHFGEWDYNLSWKPIEGFKTWFVWVDAVFRAQRSLRFSKIQIPVLVLHSNKSARIFKYKPIAQTNDVILNVDDIKRISPHLGPNVHLEEVENAVHDVFLSAKPVREKAVNIMFAWLKAGSS